MPVLSLRSGDLRHRVTLEAEQRTADGGGGFEPPTWVPVCTDWASIEPLSGQEALVARQLQDTTTHKVGMRYRDGIKAAMRVKFGERFFNITEVRNIEERNVKLELRCTEGVTT